MHLLLRNYPQDFVNRILHNITYDLRASFIPSLNPSPSPSPSPASDSIVPRLITAYSPYYTSLPALVRKHWSLIQNDPSLSTLFPTPPQLCFRKNATFADSLMKASLLGSSRPTPGQAPPIPINRLNSHIVRCGDKRCKVCPKFEEDVSCFQQCPRHHTPSMRIFHVQTHPSFISSSVINAGRCT